MSDKNELKAILEKLQHLQDNYQVREAGEIPFKEAKAALEQVIAMPAPVAAPLPEPIRVDVPVIDPALSADIAETGVLIAAITLKQTQVSDALVGIATRIAGIESALIQLVTPPPA